MFSITAKNVNDAFLEAMWKMPVFGVEEQTRNGKVLSVDGPVITKYLCPTERMLFHKGRDANPFFHVIEAMWMLAGMNDVATVQYYAKNMANYSDDGQTIHGAYGHRWRVQQGFDQIMWAVRLLISQPDTRRAVISMWDPGFDCEAAWEGKDVPCNTTIYFRRRAEYLDMTVCCRSNDVIWGCYGANAVHMSFLHEFVTQAIGAYVGHYYQVSNNWHIYEPHFHLLKSQEELVDPYDGFDSRGHVDLLKDTNPRDFLIEVEGLLKHNWYPETSAYLNTVVIHVLDSWKAHKEGNKAQALADAGAIKDEAVKMACLEWLIRRAK